MAVLMIGGNKSHPSRAREAEASMPCQPGAGSRYRCINFGVDAQFWKAVLLISGTGNTARNQTCEEGLAIPGHTLCSEFDDVQVFVSETLWRAHLH